MSAPPLDVFHERLCATTLIEASAGTGKTWNLCALVLRLLLEQALPLPRILVVTFTNAATAELRERIRARILDVLAGLQGGAQAQDPFVAALLTALRTRGLQDATLQQRLHLALETFDEASIFTIHGFCQRALAENPFAAALPMTGTLLADDTELREQVTSDFWRRHILGSDGQAISPALAALLLARKDSPARWSALLQRRTARPLARLLWPPAATQPHDSAPLHAHFRAVQALWTHAQAEVAAVVNAAQPRLPANVYKPASIAQALQSWRHLLAAPHADAADFALPKLDLLTTGRLQAKKGQAPIEAHPFFAAASELLALHTAQQAALESERLALLRLWLEQGPAALRAAKRSLRVMTYDDLLHDLHERLHAADGARLAARLRERWPVALVDEFQDTDPLQWSIFDTVYARAGAPLFLLGDPKQAIYSFRHADLHTYLQARAQASTQRSLTENQRSTPGVLAGLNALFGANPRGFVAPGLDYLPVQAGAKPRPVLVDRSAARAPLQLWALPAAADGQPLPKPEARRLAAQAVAGEIARLLAAAHRGEVTLDGRPLGAGDVAVLVRSHAQGALMRRALAALGVGCIELSQADVHHSIDAEELERVLAAMLAPTDEGRLRAALSTTLMGLDAAAIDALSDNEAALLDCMSRFAAYRDAWLQRGVGPMLRRWLQQEQVTPRLLHRADGERRLTNLRHLAERLHEASTQHAAPEALLRWLQQQRRRNDGGEAAQLRLESDRHLVAIITIHKSKGLEFPLVYCPFLWDGHPGPGDAAAAGIDYHDADGTPVTDFRPEAAAIAREPQRLARLAEDVRLVYVALTRAVQRCTVVVGPYRSGKSSKECGKAALNRLLARDDNVPAAADIVPMWAQLATANAPAVDLQPLPQPVHAPPPPSQAEPTALAALPAPAERSISWTIGSFSSLVRGLTHEAAARDHDDLPAAAAELASPSPLPIPDADDILDFPRGPEAGECLHALLERVDYGDPSTWPGAIQHALQLHPMTAHDGGDATHRQRQLQGLLHNLLHTPLLPGLQLATVRAARRLVEWEFLLPVHRLTRTALAATLARHGLALPLPAHAPLTGFLRGFVDLAFMHDGRWFVVDWKSNHLGQTPGAYAGPALQHAVHAQGYGLQVLLYAVALHRHLRQCLPGYDAARDFGGALVLFVRGVRPHWVDDQGRPCGVFALHPAAQLLDDLSALMDSSS